MIIIPTQMQRARRRGPALPAPWVRATATVGAVLALAALLAWGPWWLLAGLGVMVGLAAILAYPALGLALAAVGVPFGAWAPVPLPGGGGALTITPVLLGWTALAVVGRALLGLDMTGSEGEVEGRILIGLESPGDGGDDRGSWIAGPWPAARPIVLTLGLYLCVLASSGWWAPSFSAVVLESARWVLMAMAIGLAAWVGQSGRGRCIVLGGLLLAAGAEALFGASRALMAIGPEAFAVLGGRVFRAHGSFGQPNPFGGYMNMAWPLGAALVAGSLLPARGWLGSAHSPRGDAGKRRIPIAWGLAGLATAGLCGGALVLSWSRGAWLAALAAAGALTVVRLFVALRGREELTLSLAHAGLVAGVALAAFGLLPRPPASIIDRLASIAAGPALVEDVAQAEVTDASFSTVERLAHWAAAGSMWAERPWLGQGPGHYEIVYGAHRLPRWAEPLGHAHNDYLQALAETGVVGLAAWLALLAALLWTALRAALDRRRPWRAALGLAALGVWAATATHGLFDRLYVHDMTVHLGLLMGLVLAAGGDGVGEAG